MEKEIYSSQKNKSVLDSKEDSHYNEEKTMVIPGKRI